MSATPLPMQATLLAELDLASLAIRSIQPPSKRTHYQAVLNWLTRYQAPPETTPLQQVQGVLESFQHLCAAADFRRASQILTIELRTETGEELHNQLYTWGYCQQQVELYTQLLGKLNAQCDSIFLNGLGLAYRSLGQYEEARQAYEQSHTLALETQDVEGIQAALCNLGAIHCLLQEYAKAIEYTQQALQWAHRLRDVPALGTVLGSLGLIYQSMEDFERAAECHQRYLQVAQRLGNRVAATNALIGLGIASVQLEQFETAIAYLHQALAMAQAVGDRFSEGTALGNLAATYQAMAQPETAVQYAQQHLEIALEIGDRAGEVRAREILGKAEIRKL